MTDWLTTEELTAWRGLWQMTDRLREALNRDLQGEHGISLADYEVLGRLDASPDGARVRDLTETLAWEQSRISHQLTRMVKAGLVSRDLCEEDRRASVYALTATGRTLLDAAAPDHVAGVRHLFFDHLDAADIASLRHLVEAVDRSPTGVQTNTPRLPAPGAPPDRNPRGQRHDPDVVIVPVERADGPR